MVFPGKLSTGCHVCRRRKVKCDGVKPECHRCVKHGVKCTGYPEKFSFREYKPPRKATTTDPASPQNSAVTESSATSSPKTLRSINASSPSSSFSAISVTSETQPSRGLPECADWQSICNFMNQVVLRVHRSPCRGYLAFMPDLFQEKGDDPCLKHAILSISYLTLSNKSGHQELHLKARKNHGLSLEHLNKALGSRENAVKDEILAACLLLSIFYNLVQDGGSLSDPHMSGICNLLQLRESEQVTTKYNRSLIGWSIVQIQSQAIGTNKFQYVKTPSFVETMSKPDCVIRAGILNSESDRPKQNKLLRSLLKRASYLITEIEKWHSCIPDHWREQYQPKSIDTDTLSAPRRPDPWTITFLATTHSAQIIFYTRTLSCYQMLQSLEPNFRMPRFSGDPAKFWEIIGGRITHLVDIICYTVSSLIGYPDANGTFQPASTANFADGNGLIWPIWAVITCSFSSEDQIAFCLQALDFIGQSLGHKLALSLSKQDPSTWHCHQPGSIKV